MGMPPADKNIYTNFIIRLFARFAKTQTLSLLCLFRAETKIKTEKIPSPP